METPLFLPLYSALESHQQRLGIEGGGGTHGIDAEMLRAGPRWMA